MAVCRTGLRRSTRAAGPTSRAPLAAPERAVPKVRCRACLWTLHCRQPEQCFSGGSLLTLPPGADGPSCLSCVTALQAAIACVSCKACCGAAAQLSHLGHPSSPQHQRSEQHAHTAVDACSALVSHCSTTQHKHCSLHCFFDRSAQWLCKSCIKTATHSRAPTCSSSLSPCCRSPPCAGLGITNRCTNRGCCLHSCCLQLL